jgi:hypothetical protein
MLRMSVLGVLLLSAVGACDAGEDGQAACIAAGGQCVLGGYQCPNRGTQDCNPDHNPGGAFCCLGCSNGSTAVLLDGGPGIACVAEGGTD